jgi:hypothetical protein
MRSPLKRAGECLPKYRHLIKILMKEGGFRETAFFRYHPPASASEGWCANLRNGQKLRLRMTGQNK